MKKKKIFITTAIWGEKYTAAFVEFNLATQLSPGNIPAMLVDCDVTYQILTTQQDRQWLEQQALIQRLCHLCRIEWDDIESRKEDGTLPQGASGEKYFFLSLLQNLGIRNAIGHDFLIFNYADFIWADGSMPNIIREFDNNTEAVLSFCLPVDHDKGVAALRQLATSALQGDGSLKLLPRQATALALDNLHRETKLRFWNGQDFSITPTYLLWPVENEGLFITAYHQTILAMRVNASDPIYYNGIMTNSLDGYYSAVLAANRAIKHADNSDSIFIFSLYDAEIDSRIGGPGQPPDWREISKAESLRECLKQLVTEAQRTFIYQPIEVRLRYSQSKSWKESKNSAIATLEAFHNEVRFNPTLYNKIYNTHFTTPLFSALPDSRPSRAAPQATRLKRLCRKVSRGLTAFFVPKDIARNGGFNRWTDSSPRTYGGGAWVSLSAKNWQGHFDGGAKGKFERSSIRPNNASKYSLVVRGTQGGTLAYLAQKISSHSMLRVLDKGHLTCSGYVRRRGFFESPITFDLFIPNATDNYETYSVYYNVFRNRESQSPLIRAAPDGEWRYFELSCDNLPSLHDISRGAMLCFVMDKLNSEDEEVYFSQIKFDVSAEALPFVHQSIFRHACLHMRLFLFKILRKYINFAKIIVVKITRNNSSKPIGNHSSKPIVRRELLASLLYKEDYNRLLDFAEVTVTSDYSPLCYGQETILGVTAARHFWVGLLPEQLLNDISNPDYLLTVVKSAENILHKIIEMAPLYIGGQRALARNLWFQGRVTEALRQFQKTEDQRQILLKKLDIQSPVPVVLPPNCTHVIGLMGHLDAFVKMKIIGGDQRRYFIDISEKEIINPAFFDYWRDHLVVGFPGIRDIPKAVLQEALTVDWNWTLPDQGEQVHVHQGIARIQRKWAHEGRHPLLQLNDEHKKVLAKQKAKWGMKAEDWFVCLHVRSAGFYGDKRSTAQDFRNTPLEDYLLAIKAVTDAGGWVVRMGDPSMPKLTLSDVCTACRVIDYAHDLARSDVLDVALSASCQLFISSPSGLHTVAHAFGRPVCYVNYPIYVGFPWHPNEIFIPKLYYHLPTHRILSMEEILSSNLVHADHNHLLIKENIILFRNTPDEIAETVKEALQQDRYELPSKEESNADCDVFEQLNQRYQRNISGRLGRYFTQKHKKVLFS